MEQAERGERILQAAGELLLAWGYRRVTIDEIARRAKVGKGTVYLHWKTKDSLLLAVVLQAKMRSLQQQLERMRADARAVLPSRMMRGYYQDFLEEPVLRALYTDDVDILGRLNDAAKKEFAEIIAFNDQVLVRYLEVLRAHGLLRTDIDLWHQQYMLLATTGGFFMAEAMLYDRAPDTPEVRGELLATTIRSTLEIPPEAFRTPDAGAAVDVDAPLCATVDEAMAAAAREIIPLYEQVVERGVLEMRRQLRD
ncbi:TetR/AcrR family transcriptional regulator [Streptomyces yunnanensis]|uniref:TetR/AcrR family transcriptional regulator n=1 Tax=Streptomyces yunnanensis TaxID=156453 RepID=A0ABY8A5D5_9ACTN|nr:TetR/AcrR family transcriptional regulator [Streptomyces yunnanensis]WEB39120.1 TetR/AcrR family transcriptional regulator [Streptomyces yunnanensis]